MTAPAVRMPAEWEPHAATLLAWPANTRDWPGKFQPIPWVFAEIIRQLLPGERIILAVQNAAHERKARNVLKRAHADSATIDFVHVPLDRGWMRDISPAFVQSNERLHAVRFGFNGWAKYDNYHLDAEWPSVLTRHVSDSLSETRARCSLGEGGSHSSPPSPLPLHAATHNNRHVILEGGAIDTNGLGTLLTTEECLLDPETQVRNSGFTRDDYETVFRDNLGIANVIWLGKGIAGDDTHGHIDDLCRFVNPRTVLLCHEPDPADPNHTALEDNLERLHAARLEDGARAEIVRLPMPAPVHFAGQRLPASYANFYIGNAAVLVPTFNDENDRRALGIIAEFFPYRKVIGIHALDLVWGLGTLHCLTHELPDAREQSNC